MNKWLKLLVIPILIVICTFISKPCHAIEEVQEIVVRTLQSEIVNFDTPITRIAIASPGIADANVTSPNQILIHGKLEGVTSLIVWAEEGAYTQYRLHVVKQASRKQIMLQVKFMEVNISGLKEFGSDFIINNMKFRDHNIDFGNFGGKVSEPGDPLHLGNTVDFFLRLPNEEFTSIFKAMHEDNLLTLLAAPNITAINGSEASFLAGGEFPVPIVSGSAGMQTVTIQFKEYGIKLKFKPSVLGANLINLKIAAEVSNLDFEHGVLLSGFQIPSLVTRKVATTVELKEGEHLLIGGLLSNETAKTVSKIPMLGHIPILGKLFSSEKFQNNESELLITLTPRIVTSCQEHELPEMKLGKVKKKGKEDETNNNNKSEEDQENEESTQKVW